MGAILSNNSDSGKESKTTYLLRDPFKYWGKVTNCRRGERRIEFVPEVLVCFPCSIASGSKIQHRSASTTHPHQVSFPGNESGHVLQGGR
jgi:hypothetical protein